MEKWRGGGAVALRIENLPERAWGPTPTDGYTTDPSFELSNLVTFGVLGVAGIAPVSYDYENEGLLFRNVAPVDVAADEASSWGAQQDFSWHTDNPSGDFYVPGRSPLTTVPTYLAFYGIRNNEQVPTEVLPLDRLINTLDPQDVRVLMSNEYRVAPPASNASVAGTLERTALLERGPTSAGGRMTLRFDPNTTSALTSRAEQTLERFRTALDAVKYDSPILGSGDLLLFDNRRVLHRRLAFTPHRDPSQRRFLRRCYGVEAALTRGLSPEAFAQRTNYAPPANVTIHHFHHAAQTLREGIEGRGPDDDQSALRLVEARELIATGYPGDVDGLSSRERNAVKRLIAYARQPEASPTSSLLRRAATTYLATSRVTAPQFSAGGIA